MLKPFGTHLIIDDNDCRGAIDDRGNIQNFINELVKKLGMKKKGQTIFEYFEDNDYNREHDIVGYSVCQIISLSSIVMHINDISRTVYLDVFSCSEVDETMVGLIFSDYFKPSKMKKPATCPMTLWMN